MKPYQVGLLALLLMPRQGTAQTDSPPPAPSSYNPVSAAGHAIGAPFRALWKLGGHVPTGTAPGEAESTGVIAFEQVQGASTRLGAVAILDTDLGYAFTSHFSGDIGLPVVFVRSPFSLVTNHDWRYTTWILGDPYLDIRYTAGGSGTRFTSILTGTAPASSAQRVFGTGRFGGDWFNHIEHNFKGVTPFLNAGAASGTVNRFILPRPYSLARPYQTLGFISDFEGGASFKIARGFSIGGSLYALKPAGRQKVFSRLVAPDSAIAGDGNHHRFFDSAFETVGSSDIDRDNGYSGWIELAHQRHVNLQIGYTRSVHYAFDSITVMLNFDAGFLFRSPNP